MRVVAGHVGILKLYTHGIHTPFDKNDCKLMLGAAFALGSLLNLQLLEEKTRPTTLLKWIDYCERTLQHFHKHMQMQFQVIFTLPKENLPRF